MYSHVLVAVAMDPDYFPDDALQLAQKLLAEGGRITLLHVIEDIPPYVSNQIPKHILDEGEAGIRVKLKTMAREVKAPCEAHVIHGNAGRSIVDYADDHGADCILVRSHKPDLSDYLLGSTAARVVRHAPCSVHVLR